jgi:Holliday junction resolvase RusA-like endonuclease
MVMRYFRVDVEPRGQGRPRFRMIPVTKGGKAQVMGVAYKTREDKLYENAIRDAYNATYSGIKPLHGYLRVAIDARFPIPASTSRKNRAEMMDGHILPDKKPDIDNITKSVLDALNGIAWEDDKQVVRISVGKRYENMTYPVGLAVSIKQIDVEEAELF